MMVNFTFWLDQNISTKKNTRNTWFHHMALEHRWWNHWVPSWISDGMNCVHSFIQEIPSKCLYNGKYYARNTMMDKKVSEWVKLLSLVWLFATPWTVAHQAPPFMGFSRQEYWSGLSFPSPGDLPNPRIEPRSPDALTSEPPGKPG